MMGQLDAPARAEARYLGLRFLTAVAAASLVGLGACGGGGGGGSGGGMAPSSFVYANSPVLYNLGLEIAPNVPTSSQAGLTWSVNPSLPGGLALDPASGEISGIPSDETADQVYRISAANAFGSTHFDLHLGLVRPASYAFASSIADQTICAYIVDPKTGELRPHGYMRPNSGERRPHLMTPSKDGRALYVPYQDSHRLVTFEVDPATGQWIETASLASGLRPMHFVLHPQADVGYLALSTDNQIATFNVDPTTHSISESAPRTASGVGPQHLTIDPSARFLYALNTMGSTLSTFAIDPITHELSAVGDDQPTGTSPMDLVQTRNGRFLYVVNSRGHSLTGYSVDAQTGAPTQIGVLPVGMLPIQAEIDPTGRFLYVCVSGEDKVLGYVVDEDSGALTALGAGWDTGVQPVSLRIDPAGQFLFVGNNDTDDISSFRIDGSSGLLTPLTRARTRDLPLNLAFCQSDAPISTSANFAYVLNRTSKDLNHYKADSAGTLSLGASAAPLGSLPRAAVLDSFNRFIFVADAAASTISSRVVDPSDGSVGLELSVQPSGADPRAIAVDPSGRFLVTANAAAGSLSSFSYDETGALASISEHAVGGSPLAVTFDPTGRFLFSANGSGNRVSRFTVDPVNGALSELAPSTIVTGRPSSLIVHPSGAFLFVTLENIDRIAVYALDPDGGLTLTSSQLTLQRPVAISLDPRGQYAYAANYDPAAIGSVSMFRIDTSSGALSSLGSQLAGNNPISISVDPSARFVYVVNERSNDVSSFGINRYNGNLMPISTAPTGTDPAALAVSFRLD